MRRIRTIIAYDGTDYVGWQTQNNGIAVQEKVDQAIFEVTAMGKALPSTPGASLVREPPWWPQDPALE